MILFEYLRLKSQLDRCAYTPVECMHTGYEPSIDTRTSKSKWLRHILMCRSFLTPVKHENKITSYAGQIDFKGTPSIPETYLLSSVAWGLNLRVG